MIVDDPVFRDHYESLVRAQITPEPPAAVQNTFNTESSTDGYVAKTFLKCVSSFFTSLLKIIVKFAYYPTRDFGMFKSYLFYQIMTIISIFLRIAKSLISISYPRKH